MQTTLDHIVMKTLAKPSLADTEKEELLMLTREFPYASVLQFLYTKRLQQAQDPRFGDSVTRTALFFNNPHWLHQQLREKGPGERIRATEAALGLDNDELQRPFQDEAALDTLENEGLALEPLSAGEEALIASITEAPDGSIAAAQQLSAPSDDEDSIDLASEALWSGETQIINAPDVEDIQFTEGLLTSTEEGPEWQDESFDEAEIPEHDDALIAQHHEEEQTPTIENTEAITSSGETISLPDVSHLVTVISPVQPDDTTEIHTVNIAEPSKEMIGLDIISDEAFEKAEIRDEESATQPLVLDPGISEAAILPEDQEMAAGANEPEIFGAETTHDTSETAEQSDAAFELLSSENSTVDVVEADNDDDSAVLAETEAVPMINTSGAPDTWASEEADNSDDSAVLAETEEGPMINISEAADTRESDEADNDDDSAVLAETESVSEINEPEAHDAGGLVAGNNIDTDERSETEVVTLINESEAQDTAESVEADNNDDTAESVQIDAPTTNQDAEVIDLTAVFESDQLALESETYEQDILAEQEVAVSSPPLEEPWHIEVEGLDNSGFLPEELLEFDADGALPEGGGTVEQDSLTLSDEGSDLWGMDLSANTINDDDPDNTDQRSDALEDEGTGIRQGDIIKMAGFDQHTETELSLEPLHSIDYFASVGVRLQPEEVPDVFGRQARSFTGWIRSMKRLHPERSTLPFSPSEAEDISAKAEQSNEQQEILTETMANIYALQGQTEKAIDIYEKLSLLNPDKSATFAAKVSELKGKSS